MCYVDVDVRHEPPHPPVPRTRAASGPRLTLTRITQLLLSVILS